MLKKAFTRMVKTSLYFHVSKETSCFLHRNYKRTPEELKKNTTVLIDFLRIQMSYSFMCIYNKRKSLHFSLFQTIS